MSVKVKYKGNEILSINTDTSKKLKTSGKYCEGDIEITNTQDGGITPSGNKALTATTSTQTGIDVTNFATVSVAPTPSETKTATTNGDVTPSSGKLLSKVTVNVPQGVFPSGTKTITENGSGIDVTNYADVTVAVPITAKSWTVHIATDYQSTSGSSFKLVSSDPWIAQHYTDQNFCITLIPQFTLTRLVKQVQGLYQSNRATDGGTNYGHCVRGGTSSTSLNVANYAEPLSKTSGTYGMHCTGDGDIVFVGRDNSGYVELLTAGDYTLTASIGG